MTFTKMSLIAALLVASTSAFAGEKSELGISANMAMTSNYVWRGMTQSTDSPAIQGGFDLEYKGFYLGTWGSNVNSGDVSMEADLYLGYAGEIDKFSYDVGFIEYMYPNDTEALNFGEAYIGLGYDFDVVALSATYSVGVSTDDSEPTDNIEVGASIPLPQEIGLDLTYGMYDEVGDYYSVSLGKSFGKFDLSVAYTGITADEDYTNTEDQDNIVATIGTSF